mgnify:FL=1
MSNDLRDSLLGLMQHALRSALHFSSHIASNPFDLGVDPSRVSLYVLAFPPIYVLAPPLEVGLFVTYDACSSPALTYKVP